MADTVTHDDYSWWQDALAGVVRPITERDPQPGFYRRRSVRGGPWAAVAIYRNDAGDIQCAVGIEYEATDATLVWLECARFPVSEDAYRTCCANDGQWPGSLPDEQPALIGDNQPPETDLPTRIQEAIERAKGFISGRKIESEADANRCEAMKHELADLAKEADAKRDVEVRPHLEAQRSVNGLWKPLIEAAEAMKKTVIAATKPYLEAREAERKAAAAAAISRGTEGARYDTKGSTSGMSGKRIGLRTVTRAVITDYDAALMSFKEHPDIRALVQKLADKVAAVGGVTPGVEVKTEKVAA
jgi:hypothetical protein